MSGAQNGAGSAILAEIRALHEKVDRLMARVEASGTARGGSGGGNVASVRDIQGDRGDPRIGKKPKKWDGEFYEGRRASECPPDFLDEYANLLDWKADNPREGKEQYAKYDRLDAARCRRWAIEIREGRVKQTPEARPTPQSAGDHEPWPTGGDAAGDWGDDNAF